MAQKRMFDKSVVLNDNFLEMPDSTQNLYFHLSMTADDDGFVDNWKSIMRMTGKKEDDLKILIAKSFIIPFESGVIVIKHWRMNNFLRKDRHVNTKYIEEKNQLCLENNNVYSLKNGVGQPVGNPDKNRIDKNSIDNNIIITTTTTNIYNYIEENFGRTISSIEYEEINNWLLSFEEEVIKYAIKIAVMNNKKTFNYIKGILNNWKTAGYKTLKEIQENENRNNINQDDEIVELFDYNWLDGEE